MKSPGLLRLQLRNKTELRISNESSGNFEAKWCCSGKRSSTGVPFRLKPHHSCLVALCVKEKAKRYTTNAHVRCGGGVIIQKWPVVVNEDNPQVFWARHRGFWARLLLAPNQHGAGRNFPGPEDPCMSEVLECLK